MKKQKYIIPPYPIKFYGLLIGAIISAIMAINGVKFANSLIADPWFTSLVAAIGCIKFSKNYVLDQDGIKERILFFTVSESRWRSVGEVIIADKSNDDPKSKGDATFLVVPDCCQPFDPIRETIGQCAGRCGNFAAKIVVPRNSKEKYKGYFEAVYGNIRELP